MASGTGELNPGGLGCARVEVESVHHGVPLDAGFHFAAGELLVVGGNAPWRLVMVPLIANCNALLGGGLPMRAVSGK